MTTETVTKKVLKVEMAGSITSFRYPHFVQGKQPTYEMPPPSTIYGHICSAVGDWVDPASIELGYHFTHNGKFIDFKEHLHFGDPIQPFPFDRELLFNPRLTLYVTPIALLNAFHHPRYAVALGRSQDLMTYQSVEVIELQQAKQGYFEHTLLPLHMGPRVRRAVITVVMARYINQHRQPSWATYTMLRERVLWPPLGAASTSELDDDEGLLLEGYDRPIDLWIDPASPSDHKVPGAKRAIWFHRLVEEEKA